MRFHQHVYGRVARGYQGSSPGYQLAALTKDTTLDSAVVETLNRMSFFHPFVGQAGEARYSFFRPGKGLVAFGRSGMAADRSRAVGSFAHNLVCDEAVLLEQDVSPSAVLRSLPFLRSEADLPMGDRTLPSMEFDVPVSQPSTGRWREFALRAIDFLLSTTTGHVPLVVAPDADAWDILTELFALLPRLERTRLSFSTLFTGGVEHVTSFRLALVPDRSAVPTGAYIFQVFDSAEPEAVQPKPTAFAGFWRTEQGLAHELLAFVDSMRQGREEDATGRLPALLRVARPFRESLECLGVRGIENLLLRSADWLVAYWSAGSPLDSRTLRDTLWLSPSEERLLQLLEAAGRLAQTRLQDEVLGELAERVAGHVVAPQFIDALVSAEYGSQFRRVARRLPTSVLEGLASRLASDPFSDPYGLFEELAQRVLNGLRGERKARDRRAEAWLRDQVAQASDAGFARAVSSLALWVDQPRTALVRLASYELEEEHYSALLPAVWEVGVGARMDMEDIVRMLFVPARRDRFVHFLAEQLRELPSAAGKRALAACLSVCEPGPSDHAVLTSALEAMDRTAHELVVYYLKHLEAGWPREQTAIERLRRLEKSSRWRLF